MHNFGCNNAARPGAVCHSGSPGHRVGFILKSKAAEDQLKHPSGNKLSLSRPGGALQRTHPADASSGHIQRPLRPPSAARLSPPMVCLGGFRFFPPRSLASVFCACVLVRRLQRQHVAGIESALGRRRGAVASPPRGRIGRAARTARAPQRHVGQRRRRVLRERSGGVFLRF